MHTQRLLTAAVLGPLVFAVLWWGGVSGFALLLSAGVALCLYEYYSMVFPGIFWVRLFGVVAGLIPVFLSLFYPGPRMLVPGIFSGLFSSALLFIVTHERWKEPHTLWVFFFVGIGYIGFCASHLGLIRFLPLGRQWILFLLIVVFSGDAGAYYVGRALGKRKLCPGVSKGKTVAGAVGGLLANVVAAFLAWFLLLRSMEPWSLLFLAVVLGAVGQVGDLTESILKRGFGVKDSGSLLPGHGGVFDRVDAVLMAAPVLYWALELGLVKSFGKLP